MEQETRPVRVYLLGFSLHQNPQAAARLAAVLQNAGMEVKASAWIAQGQSQNPLPFAERAEEFQKALAWQADWILDVTGGESANGMLSLLDYEGYQASQAILAGYSDVSCVLNALSWKTGRSTLLLQASGNANEELLVQLLQKKNDRLCQPAGLNTEKEAGRHTISAGCNRKAAVCGGFLHRADSVCFLPGAAGTDGRAGELQ